MEGLVSLPHITGGILFFEESSTSSNMLLMQASVVPSLDLETSGLPVDEFSQALPSCSPSPCVSLGDEDEDKELYERLAALGQKSQDAPTEEPLTASDVTGHAEDAQRKVSLWERFQSPPSPIPMNLRVIEEEDTIAAIYEDDHFTNLPTFNAFAPDRDVICLIPNPRLALRELTDGEGRIIYTRVPIREGMELDYFLSVRFEELDREESIRFPYESKEDELPLSLPPDRSYFPLLEVFQGNPVTVFKRKLSFLRNLPEWVDELESRHPAVRDHLNAQEWKRRLRPRGHLAKFLRNLPEQRLPEEEDITVLNRTLDDETRLYTFPSSVVWNEVIWELSTYHFRHDFELLTAKLHRSLQGWHKEERKHRWHVIHYRVCRLWGKNVSYYPHFDEPRYLDSEDDLIQLKYWTAVG